MQKRTIFPYRRQGPKKRPRHAGRNKGGGGRQPNTARDLLSLMPSATKALAHMLGGKTKSSGQLKQAQAVREHAERFVAENAVERLSPSDREEFNEQYARLKLILQDAELEAAEEAQAAETEAAAPVAPPLDQARLREIALALAGVGTSPRPGPQAPAPVEDEPVEEPEIKPSRVAALRASGVKLATSRRSGDRSERLTIGAGDRQAKDEPAA
ncbi:hypothetical protein [Marinivivus vitaminiproducens]|uniref:hypothetical protein n=1 Tax=Marinivivus vitaminiproducens TaxID=3035935 RepID=UPI0027A6539F|nr:hypothetical protein P4R82_00075 [Geminicoccaceae bacterium SCSIO 64248]